MGRVFPYQSMSFRWLPIDMCTGRPGLGRQSLIKTLFPCYLGALKLMKLTSAYTEGTKSDCVCQSFWDCSAVHSVSIWCTLKFAVSTSSDIFIRNYRYLCFEQCYLCLPRQRDSLENWRCFSIKQVSAHQCILVFTTQTTSCHQY